MLQRLIQPILYRIGKAQWLNNGNTICIGKN